MDRSILDNRRTIENMMGENLTIDSKKIEVETEMSADQAGKKRLEKALNRMKKEINDSSKKRMKLEHDNTGVEGNIKELETQLSGITKLVEEKKREHEALEKKQRDLMDEQEIFVGQLVKKKLDDKTMELRKAKLEKDISMYNQQVLEFQEEENKWIEEIKFLSTIREKMARTASQAMAQQRETREELKVKELLILDLTKKQAETEFKLNAFIALYEEVKNMRNKYVSQIQNSSQDLAEMRERIKILQNEVEILRNESSDKDRMLSECKKEVAKEIQDRDSHRSELNKREFVYKQKMSIIGQKINEGDKLNLIINSLQKEMNNLIFKYEMACESRNYMGIQLIDKNDELCILYEKSNIQENILKNGEQEIRQKEEEIRMLNLELKERQRQLEVVRKQIPLVPQLATAVIELKNKLDSEKEKVENLSSHLENPLNHPKRMELEGEDAD
jgi:chromosome segregation ATPase